MLIIYLLALVFKADFGQESNVSLRKIKEEYLQEQESQYPIENSIETPEQTNTYNYGQGMQGYQYYKEQGDIEPTENSEENSEQNNPYNYSQEMVGNKYNKEQGSQYSMKNSEETNTYNHSQEIIVDQNSKEQGVVEPKENSEESSEQNNTYNYTQKMVGNKYSKEQESQYPIETSEETPEQTNTYNYSQENIGDQNSKEQGVIEPTEIVQDFYNNINISVSDCKYYVKLTAIVYCEEEKIYDRSCTSFDNVTRNLEVISVINNPKTKTQGLISIDHLTKKIVVTYRGSHNLVNWSLNIYSHKTKFINDTKVSAGFKIMANSLLDKTLEQVTALLSQYPDYSLVFTGHSMGGAVALINAFETMQRLNFPEESISIYTYGQPKTGDKNFVEMVNKSKIKVFRVFNKEDYVPHLPSNNGGYYHTNTGIAIEQDDKYTICNPNLLKDTSCAPRLNRKNIAAHFIYWDYVFVRQRKS